MADIKFTAFIESVVRNQQGDAFALRTSEPHRRKNDRDEWETTARTYRDVKVSRESGIQLAQFQDGDRIEVVGTEKTEKVRTAKGNDLYPLVVWASSITPAGQGGSGNTTVQHAAESAGFANDTPPEDPWTSTGSAWPAADIPNESVPF